MFFVINDVDVFFFQTMTSGSLFVNDSTFADHFSSFSLGASSFNLFSLFQSCWQLSSTFPFQDGNLNGCSSSMYGGLCSLLFHGNNCMLI